MEEVAVVEAAAVEMVARQNYGADRDAANF